MDDEPDIAYLFREALSTVAGIDVFAFTDPLKALEHFRLNFRNYKCVISDFRMPFMDGIQFLDEVKEVEPNVKRILISAFDIEDEIFKGCNTIDKFLTKPT